MERQVYADNVDLNGKVFETVGENIRKGAREIDSQVITTWCVTPESFGAVGDNAIGNISVSFHRPSDIIKTIAYVDTTPIIVTINTDGSIIANTNEELKGNFIFNVTYDTVSQV